MAQVSVAVHASLMQMGNKKSTDGSTCIHSPKQDYVGPHTGENASYPTSFLLEGIALKL
jgi:hypothetical protein